MERESEKMSLQEQPQEELAPPSSVMEVPKDVSKLKLNFKDELFPAEELLMSETPAVETTDIPGPSHEALMFIKSLDTDHLDQLIFKEQLVTTSETGDLGEFVISIEHSVLQEEECYLIIAKSLGYVEGVLCGTSLTAYVNKHLQTLEQRHHEFVKIMPNPLDRKTLFMKTKDHYVYIKSLTNCDEVTHSQTAWKISNVPTLILEGANILLVRALILRKHPPADFYVASIDSDGKICNSNYTDLGASAKEICTTLVPVVGLQRSISSRDNPISWRYFLIEDGHLMVRQQVGSPVIMKATQVPTKKIAERQPSVREIKFKKQPLKWETDMEMKSKFIDKKNEYMNNFSVYLGQKPEIRSLLADFLQSLLLRKPDDVFSFTASHFASFSTRLPSTQPFLNPNNLHVPHTKVPPQQQ